MIPIRLQVEGEPDRRIQLRAVPELGSAIGFPDGTRAFVRDVLHETDEIGIVVITAERPVSRSAPTSLGPLFEKEKQP